MSTIVKRRREQFTIIANICLHDKKISLKAKGLMAVLMMFPEEWEFTEIRLQSVTKDKRDSIRTALDELESAGYLQRKIYRDNGGKIRSEWLFDDTKEMFKDSLDRVGFTDTVKPTRKNRHGKSNTVASILTNTKNKDSKQNSSPSTPQAIPRKEAEAEFLDFVKKVRQDKAGSLLFRAKEGFEVGITLDGMLYNATTGKNLSVGKAKDLWRRYYEHHKKEITH